MIFFNKPKLKRGKKRSKICRKIVFKITKMEIIAITSFLTWDEIISKFSI